MSDEVLHIVSRPRLADLASGGVEAAAADTVTVSDHGLEFDKALMRINLVRRDPWFARAAEGGGAQVGAQRQRIYDGLLRLFALSELDLIVRKLMSRRQFERIVVVSSIAGAEPETFSPSDLIGARGREAVQRARCQFIAGNAAGLLAASDYRLGAMLDRFGMASGERG